MKNTAALLQDNLDDASNFTYFQWYSMVLDINEPKIFKPPISKVEPKAPTNICKISFLNKDVAKQRENEVKT